ncbi:MAG: hypothetical protein VX152_03095, partial [Pseudomonadota bacterium]|nr:hypothetical protein [Pseudomonadota bacterium]
AYTPLGVAYSNLGDHARCLATRRECAARFGETSFLPHYNLGVSLRRRAQEASRGRVRLRFAPGPSQRLSRRRPTS